MISYTIYDTLSFRLVTFRPTQFVSNLHPPSPPKVVWEKKQRDEMIMENNERSPQLSKVMRGFRWFLLCFNRITWSITDSDHVKEEIIRKQDRRFSRILDSSNQTFVGVWTKPTGVRPCPLLVTPLVFGRDSLQKPQDLVIFLRNLFRFCTEFKKVS